MSCDSSYLVEPEQSHPSNTVGLNSASGLWYNSIMFSLKLGFGGGTLSTYILAWHSVTLNRQ